MTAVVGILNNKAVAIAADSAVTLHNGKIFNKANKIFTLSKHHPIGVMIHNVDSFMGTPWETIIKMYRHQLKETSFNTVRDYLNDFISFLRKQEYFSTEEHQRFQLDLFCVGINNFFKEEIQKKVAVGDADYIKKFQDELKEQADKHIKLFSANPEILPEFIGYTFAEFDKFVEPKIQDIFDYCFINNGIPIDNTMRLLLKQAYYNELIVKEFRTTSFTGLVFTGFGDKETFPSLISIHIFIGFDKKLRYFENTSRGAVINHNFHSAVCTFAQSDVMFTILTGVAPDLQETYNLNFKNFVNDFSDLLLKNYTGMDKGDLMFLLNKIDKDKITQTFVDTMQDVIQKKYITPLFDAVAALAKEDLAEMAESLIYLTYLQRRITNAEETVGGPVDVAVISKGDGFIWIKRKQYFNQELNSHFLKKYFM